MSSRRLATAADLQAHDEKDDLRHAELMRFMGATEQYIKTAEEDRRVMFQGIADLTKLIGSNSERIAEEKGKSKSNQLWVNAMVSLGAATLGSGVTIVLMLVFHLH